MKTIFSVVYVAAVVVTLLAGITSLLVNAEDFATRLQIGYVLVVSMAMFGFAFWHFMDAVIHLARLALPSAGYMPRQQPASASKVKGYKAERYSGNE